jgi:hypothetical protein
VGEPAALDRKRPADAGGPRCARHGGGERGVKEPDGRSSLHFNSVRRSRLRLGSGSTSLLPIPIATRWSVWPKPSVRTAPWSTSPSWGHAGAKLPDCGWGRSASRRRSLDQHRNATHQGQEQCDGDHDDQEPELKATARHSGLVGRHSLPTPLLPWWCQRRGLRVRVPQRRPVALQQLEEALLAPGGEEGRVREICTSMTCAMSLLRASMKRAWARRSRNAA